jgi:hypothetical protein
VTSRFAKNVVYFALGFLLFELVRRTLVPPVPGPIEKGLAPLLAQRNDCSVLVVGPSYVASQILPEVFNREAERIRLRERICRFGTAQLRGYELRRVLERLLEHDWPRLKVVVIDITLGDGIAFEPENWMKPRVVEWHTLGSVPWLLRYYDERRPLPLGDRLPRLLAHAKHLSAHYAEVGHGIELVGSFDFVERLRPDSGPLPKRRSSKASKRKRERGDAYRRHVQGMIEQGSKRRRNDGSAWALELRELVRARGKEAYFLIAPVLYSPAIPKQALRGKDRIVLFDYNDPRRYPELYEERVRGRTSHLNKTGSTRYSELFARELKEFRQRKR